LDSETNYWLRRARTGRFTRRSFIGGAAATGVGAASLGLVGCGSDNNSNSKTPGSSATVPAGGSATAAASETPKPGGSYTPAFTGPFAGVDPHNSVYGGAGIVPEAYNYLVRTEMAIHPEKGVIDDLAESHKVEADNVTWTFKIRQGVNIAQNDKGVAVRALDSSDALASWNRIADPKAGTNGYTFTSHWVDKMDAPDANTFRMVLKKPFAWTEASIGNNLVGAIVPKEWLANPDLKKWAVGAGPFVLSELVEGDHSTMVKNPTYYKQGKPYLDKYVIRAFSDLTTERTAFSSGQIDRFIAPNQDEAKQLKNDNKDLQYYHEKDDGYLSFWMNTKQKPWDDPRVRRAINLATNRDEYIQIIGHGVGEPIGLISYVFGDYALTGDALKKAQPYDVGEAKKLFDAAGIKEFSFSYPTSSNVADYVNIFVKQMGQAGVTAKGQPLDAGTWVAGYYTSKLSASLSLKQEYQTPDAALQWYVTGGITGNGHYDTGFSDPEVDAAVAKAAGTLDEAPRKAAYIDAQKLIFTKDPAFINFFGLYSDTLYYPYSKNPPVGLGSPGYAFLEDMWTTKS
jgi:ABC-type transport system substrate-binding protein